MQLPALHSELRLIAEEYLSGGRAVVRKAAKVLLKAIDFSAKQQGD